MENSTQRGEQNQKPAGGGAEEGKNRVNVEEQAKEELPTETSPYVNYGDLEDYKRKGYGTEGHLEPVEGPRGAGATDAPTPSGRTGTPTGTTATSTINNQGVP